ncbi:hypothetical protein TWF696_005541 [Orbilia brochopaga]|uniref:Uncharacterized protein n=1 Tax=Orbilia brochopaga TaxID=3140254 RepID=A0AAV9V1V0_9PEZI
MRSSIVGLAVLGVWAGSSFARSMPDEEIEALRRRHKWGPRAADEYGPPDPNWDENAAVRDLSPAAFPSDTSDHGTLNRRQLALEIASYNMQPDVLNADPVAMRKNPPRKHQEYFCYWRTPRPGFSPQNAYDAINVYLSTIPMEMCSGPGGYCTPVYCKNGYVVSVCNWNKKAWQILCYDLMMQARDIAVAVGNNFESLWETGIDPTVSETQLANDRKKICIAHSSVYTPEMIGYTFFNTNPQFQIQLHYGFPDDRITCEADGKMFPNFVGEVKRQDDYEWDWYSVATDKKLDELEEQATKEQQRKSGAKPDALPPPKKDNSSLPLPVEQQPDDGEGGQDYKGPNLKDYDPESFIPPDQLDQWRLQQWQKSHSAEIASRHKAAHKSLTRTRNAKEAPRAKPTKVLNSFPAGYTKSVNSARKAAYRSQAAQRSGLKWTGSVSATKTAGTGTPVRTPPAQTTSPEKESKDNTLPAKATSTSAGKNSAPSASETEPASSTAVAASKTSDTEPPAAASAVKTSSAERPSSVSTRAPSATPEPSEGK